MLKAVLFDLYETLITEWENGEKKAPFSTERLGIDQNLYKKEWHARLEKRMTGAYPDYLSVLHDILQSTKIDCDEDVIQLVNRERHKAKAVPFFSIEEWIIGMLSELKYRGLKIGLISNCTPEEVTEWVNCTLTEYFDDVIFSYEVRLAKPDPRIYHLACARLGVTPEEAIFIGDGGSNEWEGAERAGIRPLHAAWYQPKWLHKGDPNVRRLENPTDLINVVDALQKI